MARSMKFRSCRLAAVGLAFLLLTSCSVLSRVIVFNNTAGTAGFAVNDEKLRQIAPGEERWIHSGWRCLEDHCSSEIAVERNGYRYSYKYGGSREEFPFLREYSVRKWHPARNVIKMQLNADGSLFVVRPGQRFPISAMEAQPSGFPLHPIDRSPLAEED
jgi:hypothetical protein